MSKFKTVGIIGKQVETALICETLERLATYLESRGRDVFFDGSGGTNVSAPDDRVLSLPDMGERCSLVVVVGGDGTLLHAARSMAGFGVPLVGINLGRLGFLVDVSPEEIETCLDPILDGEYDEDPPDDLDGVYRLNDNEKAIINPGSVGQPRDLDPRSSYAILDDEQGKVEFFRLPYQVDVVVDKIKAVPELSDWLGERLREGR